MTWFDIDPDEHRRSPYDLSADNRDLLVKDLDKRLELVRATGKEVTTRVIVDETLDLMETWHG